jgi:hypothetical protein
MKHDDRRGALIMGVILVFIGGMALLSQVFDVDGALWGMFIVLGLGLAFMLAGIVTREFGFFVPGGILTGIGAGIVLTAGPWQSTFSGDEGGLFMLAFAGGWFLIPIMGLIFTRQFHWWPFIPGGIIGLVGLAIIYGGALWTVLQWMGYLWPVVLIVVGVWVLFKAFAGRDSEPEEKPIEKTV